MSTTTTRHTRGRGPTFAGQMTANMFSALAGLELMLDAAVLRGEAAHINAIGNALIGLPPIHTTNPTTPKDPS